MVNLPSAPAAQRNMEPIAAVLDDVLPERGLVLEIASGTGEHAVAFAARFPSLEWQPTDADSESVEWIRRRVEETGLANVRDPLLVDAASDRWEVAEADALLCINMVHISPWAATLGMLQGAARLLSKGAPLVLYGPYRQVGVETAASNEAFDASLRARNPEWGLRQVDEVSSAAAVVGLELGRIVNMPANNLTLVFRRL